jgi:hypothetical protein
VAAASSRGHLYLAFELNAQARGLGFRVQGLDLAFELNAQARGLGFGV